MLLDRWRERIEPMHRAHVISQRLLRSDVLDSQRNNGLFPVERLLHLAADLPRSVGMSGKNENHDAATVDRVNDGRRPIRTRRNIPWRYPATDAFRFKLRARGIRHCLVLMRITDEYVEGHATSEHIETRHGSEASAGPVWSNLSPVRRIWSRWRVTCHSLFHLHRDWRRSTNGSGLWSGIRPQELSAGPADAVRQGRKPWA